MLLQLQRRHGLGRDSRHTDAIEELKNAFEIAERSSPGITNRYRQLFLLAEKPIFPLQPFLFVLAPIVHQDVLSQGICLKTIFKIILYKNALVIFSFSQINWLFSVRLVEEILRKLQPGLSESRVNHAVDNLSRQVATVLHLLVKLPLGSFPAANPAAAGTTWSRHLAGGVASPPNLKYRSQPPPLT